MPTIVLLDVSASLLRPADPSDPSTTRQDIAQRGILQFLQVLEKWQELEPVSLLTFSETSRVLVPFTTNHAELRRGLYDVSVQSAGRIGTALESACQILDDQCGRRAPGCQVISIAERVPGI
jgi:Mg-chelatase subunit ChlD